MAVKAVKDGEAMDGQATKAAALKNNPPQRGNAEQIEKAERAERLQKIVAGRIPPPNETVGYFVGQLRKIFAETDQVNRNLQQARAAVEQAEARARELRGMRSKYLEDIENWDKPIEETEKEGEQ